ncbi:MAG: glycosyltransferase family 4 protein [Bacteroidetes bacterium]|nr:glycosyltransferase family 4 protein [Bacteroidota bacterium]
MKRLKIGIDAKWYSEGPPSGKLVINEWVQQFSNFPEYDFYLFLRKSASNHEFKFSKNIQRIFINPWSNFSANQFSIPRLADKLGLDCVIYQNFPPLKTKHKRIAFIHDVIFETNPEYYSLKERIYFKPLRFLANHSDMVLTVSGSEENRLRNTGYILTNQLSGVVPNGVDSGKFDLLPESESFKIIVEKFGFSTPYVLFVGRLNVRKNILGLINSIQFWQNPELKLVIAGKPDGVNEISYSMMKNLQDSGKIIFTGFVRQEDLISLMRHSACFCFPSFDEGFGLPPLEAMAAGTPVVVSDCSSMPEVCGQNAIYVNPQNPVKIAEGINKVLNMSSDERQSLISTGKKYAADWSWKKSIERLIYHSERVVNGSNSNT